MKIGFGAKLAALCAFEMDDANHDAARIGAMIERLANSLAFTIAISARGNPKAMQELLTGAEGYLYAAATDHQRIGALIASSPSRSKP